MRPLVISHRTNMGTMPENTLVGVDAALRDGVDAVEIDVRATADGVVVLLHDASLARTTGDPRDVSAVSLAELRSVRVRPFAAHATPEPVPTLGEALARIAGRCVLAVEIKQADIEQLVAAEIRAAAAESWCWIWAFDPAIAAAHRRALPGVPVALNSGLESAKQYGYGSALEAALGEGLAAISLDHQLVDAPTVEAAHRAGLQVYTWTADATEDIERVANAGVDGICGNFPTRIRDVLAAREA